ncbi:AraC family transcriptional regulator [Emticicia aquatilis]|uniref:AraC family transcriptional regulator n=1 Tax=Emticicia aquatilis TaxID=1537369 RepID=A0A916Z4E2_9BACT|nr:helix-turn-helix domain-containing protein [Emticicia aquatilis]GGD75582.1 AraC family transcriptional regulator [Emticicia aquatilis]
MQIAPSKELLPFIKHYLFLESEGQSIKKLRLFSDGNTGMVFCLKGNLITNTQNHTQLESLPSSFTYGQISEFKDLFLTNRTSLIVVVFQPSGINQLLGIAAHQLRDKIIDIADIFGLNGLSLHEILLEQENLNAKLYTLNTFFRELAKQALLANHALIQASLHFIIKTKGLTTIGDLVKHTGYTERHIERLFSEVIGLSPKKFGNIIKLHNFLKLLKSKSKETNITHFCYESGYADQSHLIKEFRKYTGITPTQYLNDTNRLAINFMELTSEKIPMSDLYNLQ